MTTTTRQLEIGGTSATLYLSGPLCRDRAAALSALCASRPATVRTLRIDLHGVRSLGGDAVPCLQSLLREWRTSRGGDFRLSISSPLLLATHTEGTVEPDEPRPWSPALAEPTDALMASFL